MTSIHTITTGTIVRGLYCGVSFSGIVTSHRAHTMNHRIELFFVELEQPISVFGLERSSLCVNASDSREALAKFLGGDASGEEIKAA